MKVFIVSGTGISEAFSTLKAAKAFCRDNFDKEFPWDLEIETLEVNTSYVRELANNSEPCFSRFKD